MDITLSLVSHTNVGKTTLARTLLGVDVGEVRDAPHVTEFADGHGLIASPQGDRLRLWDTPGFGDSARLLQRLRGSAHPLGWLLSQVWDRWRDRPFWLTQQALRHVQAESDVLLYLVNAAESPAAAGYVAPEMDLLAWVGKPVLVLLNQLGAPRTPDAEAADVQAWRSHLQRWPGVAAVLPMDAFARCWVHETALLHAVQDVLRGDRADGKAAAMASLVAAWSARRQATFDAALHELSCSLARIATMRQTVDDSGGRLRQMGATLRGMGATLGQLARRVVQPGQPSAEGAVAHPASNAAQQALAAALEQEVAASTGRLLGLHGLAGRAQAEILQRVAGQFASLQRVPEGQVALWGGAVTGALAGLKADIATGGLTLGGGMLAGALLGALGAAGLARGINVVRGSDQTWVRWSDEAMSTMVQTALLRYLAVAHFGRGRGEWVDGEAPAHWRDTVATALAPEQAELAALWAARERRSPRGDSTDGAAAQQQSRDAAAEVDQLAAALQPVLTRAALAALRRLYPAATVLLGQPDMAARHGSP